ncbi:MAG TPA: hypothetical protein VES60_02495 [Nakamurella sp.]|nr:hypothetical protein [Nakamurella sp.]
MVDGDVREDLPASVITSEPSSLLEYSWGPYVLRWELAPIGVDTDTIDTNTIDTNTIVPGHTAGTRLTLQHTVAGRDWIPNAAAGWHLWLLVAERLLNGHPIDPIRGRAALNHDWASLNEAYATQLGIPATGWPEHTTHQ